MSLSNEAAQAVAATASKAMYGGTSAAILGWLTFNQWLALGGFVVGLAGFVVNWAYKHKHYKLAERRARLDSDDGDGL